jgi:hypothetical protein
MSFPASMPQRPQFITIVTQIHRVVVLGLGRLAVALAVIPRDKVKFSRVGNEQIAEE